MPCVALRPRRREGAIVPLTAFMLIVILAFLSLAIDLGYVILVRGELQNAADSAALAGASQLLNSQVLAGTAALPGLTQSVVLTNVRAEADKFSQFNYGGKISLTLNTNPSNSPTGDIVGGHIAKPSNQAEQIDPNTYPYNAVQVRVRRDNTRNTPLDLFFARIMGVPAQNVTATATAAYAGQVTGFRLTDLSGNAPLLPLAIPLGEWQKMIGGSGPDNWTRNPPPVNYKFPAFFLPIGNVQSGPDGIPEANLSPVASNLAPSTINMVSLGTTPNALSKYTGWTLFGMSSGDQAHFSVNHGFPNGFALNPLTGSMTLEGTQGVPQAMEQSLNNIAGQPRIITVYSNVQQNGNKTEYTIVGFGGCTVLKANLNGPLADQYIRIQPCFTVTSTAVSGSGGQGGFVYQPLALIR